MNLPIPPLPTITPFHVDSYGLGAVVSGMANIDAASATYPSASIALFYPFVIAPNVSVSFDRMFTWNGAAISDSIDLGIYTPDGLRLRSVGLTAQSGSANVLQIFTLSGALMLGPGPYYLAICMNGTTGTFFRRNPVATTLQAFGAAQVDLTGESTPGTLPATVTLAAMAQAYVPVFGIIRTGFTV